MSVSGSTYRGISLNHRKDFRGEHYLIEHILRTHLSPEQRKKLTIIWPYLTKSATLSLIGNYALTRLTGAHRPSIFITHENVSPRWLLAPYQIGFHADIEHPRYFRFPNWQLHLNWPELHTQPIHNRFGTRLDIERLLRPIDETFGADERKKKAVMFSSHLNGPRRPIFEVVDRTLGCDGFGKIFNKDTRLLGGKYDSLKEYRFSLCPENSIGPGYLTEKIPEAFYAGCIPISWCRPEDLSIDFNPNAVVNLYGLPTAERESVLERLRDDEAYVQELRSEPLLLKRPSLAPMIEFLKRAALEQ